MGRNDFLCACAGSPVFEPFTVQLVRASNHYVYIDSGCVDALKHTSASDFPAIKLHRPLALAQSFTLETQTK